MKLLITEPIDFSEKALKLLKNNFKVETLDHINQLSNTIFDVEVLFVRLGIDRLKRGATLFLSILVCIL